MFVSVTRIDSRFRVVVFPTVRGCVFDQKASTSSDQCGRVRPVLSALDRGDVLLIDELGRSLHPHLLDSLVGLFQNQHTNPRCAQLIFSTHTANVLGDITSRRIGRDQVWFTQKAPDGASKLYPLTDFSPRQDEAVARRYLQGRYGAVPSCRPAR